MGFRFYVAIDDTDNLESRGTGHQARALASLLADAVQARNLGVTRHQLLVDPRIPYTSHNSSACILVDMEVFDPDSLIEQAAAFLTQVAAPGSDAGLCVAAVERVTDLVVEFGQRAKREVLTVAEAHALASDRGIHLSGHTGQRIGVIGALAAVGLRHSGNDGRFLELKGLRNLAGAQLASALRAAGIARYRTQNDLVHPTDDELVDVGEWCRPILEQGEPTLLVEEVHSDGDVRWRIAAKERIKEF